MRTVLIISLSILALITVAKVFAWLEWPDLSIIWCTSPINIISVIAVDVDVAVDVDALTIWWYWTCVLFLSTSLVESLFPFNFPYTNNDNWIDKVIVMLNMYNSSIFCKWIFGLSSMLFCIIYIGLYNIYCTILFIIFVNSIFLF